MQSSGPIKAENRGLLLCPPLAAPPSYSEDFPFNQWYMPYSSTKTPHTSRFPSFSPLLPASTPTDLGGPDSSVTNCHMGSIQGSIVSDQGTSNHAAITVPSLHPLPQAPVRAHVPRPPNAFMLFRSDFLKRGVIPSNVERRQQQLSRVAGQCWNLLPQEEKTIWQQRATEVLTEHQKRNPNYKFTPSPRGSRRSKVIGRSEINKAEGEDRIRKIRETYTQITGPAVRSARRRRPKVHTQSCDIRKTNEHELLFPQIQTSHSVPSSPSSIQQEPPLPPFFPQYSFPHVIAPRRPSTSLGFSLPSVSHKDKPLQSGRSLTRPPSAASSETGLTPILGDLDITPAVSYFHDLSLPAMPASPVVPDLAETGIVLCDLVPFSALNSASPVGSRPSSPPRELPELQQPPRVESFFGSLYSSESFAFLMDMPPDQQGSSPLEDSIYTDFFHSTFNRLE